MDNYRILVLADIHGNIRAVNKILSLIKKQSLEIDLILIAGDLPETTPIRLMLRYIITHGNLSKSKYTRWVYKERGRSQFVQNQIYSVKNVLTLLSSLEVPIVYVPGNVDSHEVQQIFLNWSATDVYFLTASEVKIGSLRVLGLGGSQFTPERYPEPLCDMEFYPQDFITFQKPLYKVFNSKKTAHYIDILLTHESPAFRYTSTSGVNTGGSTSISEIINHINPKLTVFGHYHELSLLRKGDHTIYVNPGPLTCYYFAFLNVGEKSVHVSLKKMNPKILDIKNMIYGYRMNHTKVQRNVMFD